ncbi:Zinc finger C2H2 [Penicillium robsamsonii]|uniref:Zinc finger C2H2 n=1 Tax=Penicillium robsamsonii TaxID=1792511 RepID=UPI002546AA27|nr:Zinc finger C2H2 [Penicillium robsamsonii]KAJ5827493.1 Zinc finger C2H2 [Penicillium robsamsonii]
MRTKHNPTLKYMANIMDFGEHSNNEIQRAMLPRTEPGYSHTLLIFDEPLFRRTSELTGLFSSGLHEE